MPPNALPLLQPYNLSQMVRLHGYLPWSQNGLSAITRLGAGLGCLW